MKFNPYRLSVARKRRMLNKKELAEKIDVNSHTIVLWEKGDTEPVPERVDAFAEALRFPTAFFYGVDIDEPNGEAVSFRSQTCMSASERDAALAAGSIGFLISDWIGARFDLPTSKIPDLHLLDADQAARTLRQEWGLGEQPIPNMIQLLESKGVRVFSLVENTTHVNAYSLWRKGTPYVFLNTIKSAESSRFDAAHELAHLVLHQDGKVTGREAEDQANKFASAFLMPKADVISTIPRVQYLQQLITKKRRWRVSLAALNYRIHKLGLITDWKNRDFCIEIARLGYNKNEPEPIEREKSSVWDKVIKALWAENTTHLDIASQLNIPTSEVVDLLLGVLNNGDSQKPIKASPLRVVQNDE